MLVPRNSTATSPAITVSVVRALRHSGARNAGTPLDTASTPVMALQPSAKARIRSNRPSVSAPGMSGVAGVAVGASPRSVRSSPTPMSRSIEPRNRYVGTANTLPLSRTPRRLTSVTRTMHTAEIGTIHVAGMAGNAEVIAATPAATLTATVST
jgi:hypothetical protein